MAPDSLTASLAVAGSPGEVSPEQSVGEAPDAALLAAIARLPAGSRVVVDADETLFLGNTTEAYLSALRPALLGSLLLFLLDLLRPWRFLPGRGDREEVRDWVRVVVATLLFPWTPLWWRHRAQRVAREGGNRPLLAALAGNPGLRLVVGGSGLGFIIAPLLEPLGLAAATLATVGFWRGRRDLARGVRGRLGPACGGEAPALILSTRMEAGELGPWGGSLRSIRWPGACREAAITGVFIPFLYMERAKRPGSRYFLKVVLLEDFAIVGIAMVVINPFPHILALTMLGFHLSLWCIYEAGYVENDRVAERYEADPHLNPGYQRQLTWYREWKAWLWAAGFAVAGLACLGEYRSLTRAPDGFPPWPTVAVSWLGVLLLVRLTYRWFNYLDKPSRPWVYLLLQSWKYYPFALIAPIYWLGAAMMSAQILARWQAYILYRTTAGGWPDSIGALRFVLLLLLMVGFGLARGELPHFLTLLEWIQGGLILLVFGFKGRKHIRRVLGKGRWITSV
ncbi:MAG: hypothetical protein HQL59_10005 [Magnetococcales bacterium]|nr:hypothetical protein [Magnetococcales bacterium]